MSVYTNLISQMHDKFKVTDFVNSNFTKENLCKEEYYKKFEQFIDLRVRMIQEEVDELKTAVKNKDHEETVDAIVDALVFLFGLGDILKIDIEKAYKEVMEANIKKVPGIKPNRPNPYGLPDLIKPEGWEAPTHKGNHGILSYIAPF